MDFATLSSIITVLAVVTFAGIVVWAMSGRQSARFAAAARLPFAIPDESATGQPHLNKNGEGR